MKSPFSYQNQPLCVLPKHKKMLDVTTPQRAASSLKNSFHGTRTRSASPSVFSKQRGLDGIHREKRTLFIRLKEHSVQDVLWRLFRKGELYWRLAKRTVIRFTPAMAPHKMLYGSLIGGVAFGIIAMGFMEHFFGPGVFARSQVPEQTTTISDQAVLGATDTKQADYNSETDIFAEYFSEIPDAQYKEAVQNMVKGYPIEAMLPYIFEQDRLTVAFLIGIGRKESNWGKRVPVLDGQDCFNYWGYRGVRRLMGTGGHTCFNSSQDAVETVAKRLNTLIYSEELNTPEKMIVWKCGFSCNGHSRESVKKWISDVDMYFKQLKGRDE